jgi:hypothetical protein
MCSSAPDTSAQAAVAGQQVQLSNDQLDFAKQVYADSLPASKQAAADASNLSQAQTAQMQQQAAMAKQANDFYTGTYQPLQQEIVTQAENYDTPTAESQASQQAIADTQKQVTAALQSGARDAASRGVDPSSGNFAAMTGALGVQGGASAAANANAAVTNVKNIGTQMKTNAAQLGLGLPAQALSASGTAVNSGSAATGTAATGLAEMAAPASALGAAYSGAISGLGGAAGTYNGITNAQMAGNNSNASEWGALGTTVGSAAATYGAYLAALSDKRMKNSVKPTSPEDALEAVVATPVSSWKYKDSSPANDGGQIHIGPMAQDVRKNMGERAGPGGTAIDLVSLNGINMAAIQGLHKKISRIAKKVGVAA